MTRDEIVRKVVKAGSQVSGGSVSAWLGGRRIPLYREQAEHLIKVLGQEATSDEQEAALTTWENVTEELAELKYRQAAAGSIGDGVLDELLEADSEDLSSGRYITAASGLSESAMVTKFRNSSEFYTAGKEQAQSATQIKVTYIRHCPPSSVPTPAAIEYFCGLVEWARSDAAHQFQRIIGIPVTDGVTNREVLGWVQDHHAETRDIRNYELRAFSWTPRGDGVNIALMDEDVSFLAISGLAGRAELKGCRVHSRILNAMLTVYFDQLWLGVDPVEKYLRDNHMS